MVDRARAWQPVGGQLGTYTGDGRVHLWQPGQPDPTISFFVDPTNQYPEYAGSRHFAFSPDGTKLIAGTSPPFARVFDVSTGEPTGIALEHHEAVYDADFSPDGRLLLAADSGLEAILWEVGTSRMIGAPIWAAGHTTLAAFSPDGHLLLTNPAGSIQINRIGMVQPVDIPRVDPEDARLAPHVESYEEVVAEKERDHRASFALSPDGRLSIKYARVKGVLAEIVDAKTNQLIRAVQGTRATPQVYWKPDSREFITASWNNTKIHDAANGDAKDDIG